MCGTSSAIRHLPSASPEASSYVTTTPVDAGHSDSDPVEEKGINPAISVIAGVLGARTYFRSRGPPPHLPIRISRGRCLNFLPALALATTVGGRPRPSSLPEEITHPS